ncbi:TPA: hypothetical protein NHL03_000387 [Pseudomonas aeruginosa]|uniref:hypothetical protein n=1 Tax=Pseudomonas aeruginosa TaxID=287 RepID=UPI0003B9545D|nr:hypothetical protein [Pseudomonas aeruginosa]ERY61546.1 hypothetical protein Q055_05418 [Pseudomonas aeruginosa BL01]HCE6030143.1 hypothetical protein [Pseudomonas aeruginosa]
MRGLAQGGNYPTPYILDLVAVLPEVITQLTADPAASSVVGGLETLDQMLEWQLRAVGQAQGLSQVDDPAQSRHCLSHCDRFVTDHHHARIGSGQLARGRAILRAYRLHKIAGTVSRDHLLKIKGMFTTKVS